MNALSGLQSNAHIARKCRPDKRSASGNFAFIITLKPGKPGFFILICNNPKKCEVPRRFHISLYQGGFTMVYVRDDGDITQFFDHNFASGIRNSALLYTD